MAIEILRELAGEIVWITGQYAILNIDRGKTNGTIEGVVESLSVCSCILGKVEIGAKLTCEEYSIGDGLVYYRIKRNNSSNKTSAPI